MIQNALTRMENGKGIFGLKWTNDIILTQTDFMDKIEQRLKNGEMEWKDRDTALSNPRK